MNGTGNDSKAKENKPAEITAVMWSQDSAHHHHQLNLNIWPHQAYTDDTNQCFDVDLI